MPIFKRKEKNLIPEVNPGPGPAGGGGSGAGGGGNYNSYSSNPVNTGDGRGKKEKPDPEGFEKLPGRTYQRERYNYQPTSSSSRATQPGGYGNYGNYGQPQQPPPIEGGQGQGQGGYSGASSNPGGYGGYSNNARNDLFKGARAPAPTTGASFDSYAAGGGRGGSYGGSTGRSAPQSGSLSHGYDEGVLSGGGNGAEEGREGGEQDQEYTEEDDEVEAIKQQIRFTKQESLSTTRNAIRTAREAEETAQRTLGKLGEQTDRIANTELALDRAKGYNSRAADGAKQIKQLNQSIFKPSFTFNKSGKRDAEEQRILARHLEEKADREEAREAAYASRERVEQGFREAEKSSRSKFGFNRNGNNDGESSSAAPKTGRAKWEQGGRYQFEASNSDDELEAELDDNLDEIAGLTSRLKILATTAGKEIDAQNKHLDKVSGKVDNLDDKILMNTQYLKRIK